MSENKKESWFSTGWIDKRWCKLMGYHNPYLDPFNHHLYGDIAVSDAGAYERYPDHAFVYDKLWVARSQGLRCGLVGEKGDQVPELPVFIKPRWGHKSAGSRGCQAVETQETWDAAIRSRHAGSDDVMWSDMLTGPEGMTDFMVDQGRIVYEMCHVYSPEQVGFTDAWKLTSPHNRVPGPVRQWVEANMGGYTGCVNVQYRGDKIFEVGLRMARSGAYLVATDNERLLENCSSVMNGGRWDFEAGGSVEYTPFYTFKVSTYSPTVALLPERVMRGLIEARTRRPFHEYYFEPCGKKGMVFYQFMHDDLEKGKALAKTVRRAHEALQALILFLVAIGIVGVCMARTAHCIWTLALVAALCLVTASILNPIFAVKMACRTWWAQRSLA